jgi:hypothetical protein
MDTQPADYHRQQSQGPPSTASVLWAEWRRGLKDLQNIVLNPWQGQVATHEEPGTIANPTNYEVYRNRHQESASPEASARSKEPMPTQTAVPSPGEIADAKSAGSIHGESKPDLPSPGEISDGQGQDAQQGQQQSKGHTQDRGRGM